MVLTHHPSVFPTAPSLFLSQVGPEGAGHFVKMVHNGIEYGDMQLICEAYHLMRSGLGMSHTEMSQVGSIRYLALWHLMQANCLN